MAEPTKTWTRSSYCADNACIEVAAIGDVIAVRDAKNVERPFLRFSREAWTAFLDGVAAGDFRV
jgi:hypothetical protein